MLRIPLGPDDTFLLLAPRGADLGPLWQIGLLVLALLVPVGLIAWLYRYELRLVTFPQACGLLALRLTILLLLWLAVGLRPHVAEFHADETPGRVRVAVDLSSSMDITDLDETRSRRAVVADVLSPQGKNLLERLAERHEIEIVGFHQESFDLQQSQLIDVLAQVKSQPATVGTNLQAPLSRVNSSKASPLLGIVVFSDGRHTFGPLPFERADELGRERIPIYPVVIGSKEPPTDLMILDVQAPTKLFKDADMPVEIRIKASQLPPQELTVEMQIGDKPVRPEHRKIIPHDGKDDVFTIRFEAKMDEAGTHPITVRATSAQKKEITLANNTALRVVRVADDKAKVLLVDGEARWEYHYLAVALLRDPKIAVDRVVFTQPRIGAIKDADLDKAGLAKLKLPEVKAESKERDPLLEYDCILLGDVAPEDLPVADRCRLEKYVGERGGTLILIAGKRHMPLAFANAAAEEDPLAKMLPLTNLRELKDDAGFTLRPTGEGKLQPFLQLEPDRPNFAWPELPKHFWGVTGKRKPAATALLTPIVDNAGPKLDDSETGIFLQQNYGFGRVLFLGIDSTWRWRYRVGDTYHHRFWGQLARWSAADRLLPAGNRHVRYGAREPVYFEGDKVDLAARLSATLPPLKHPSQARVKLHRRKVDGAEELAAVIPLPGNPRQPGTLEAIVRDLAPGAYRIELDIPEYRAELAEPADEKEAAVKGRDLFHVLPREQTELLDLSADWALMQSLAERSDGRLYTSDDAVDIVDRLARRVERKELHREQRPWQDEPMVWWMLGLLLGLLTIEWVWRRWLELA